MALLALGVFLWSFAHLLKSAAPGLRDSLIESVGADRYRGLFALTILLSIVLIVMGWRSTPFIPVYPPASWGRHVTMLGMLASMLLFAGSGMPSNIKRAVRHPQLTGVVVWSISHLLANGDAASLVLFGGIGVWAGFSIVLISRREGEWKKPAEVPAAADARVVAGAIVVYIALFFAHPYLFGVSPM
jgi:uncharacterized membrane protein